MNPVIFTLNLLVVLLATFGAVSLAILAREAWRERKGTAAADEPQEIRAVDTTAGRVEIPSELSRAVARMAHEDALGLLNAYALCGPEKQREIVERAVAFHQAQLEEAEGVPTPETLRRWLNEGGEGEAVQRG